MATPFYGGRKLKLNHVNSIPRHIVTVKCISNAEPASIGKRKYLHTFRTGFATVARLCGVNQIGVKRIPISQPETFHHLLESTTRGRQTTWVVGHNVLNDFRLLCIPELFATSRLSVDWPRTKRTKENGDPDNPHCHGLAVIESPPTIIACRVLSTQGRVVFVDIGNWFDATPIDLAATLGRESQIEPPWDCDYDTARNYCDWVCSVVHDTFCELCKYSKENDLGLFRYTAAGQALSLFRHRCQTHELYFHEDNSIKQFERRAYFGGRTEVFRKGKIDEPVYKLDVSSFYPSLMLENQFPYTIDSYEIRQEFGPPPTESTLLPYVAECLVNTKRAIYPCRVGRGVYYCTGQYETVLAGPELETCRSMGDLLGVRTWTRYKLAPLFGTFVRECWKLRQAAEASGNKIYAQLIKSIANSLYGKFAQLSPIWEFVPGKESALPWSRWVEIDWQTKQTVGYRSFGWNCQREIGKQEKENTFPAISAFVTSYGRLRMNFLRGTANPDNVLYQGVDSLIVNAAGYDTLQRTGNISERQLGELRLHKVTDYGEIRGCADYTLGDEIVIAGKPGMLSIEDAQDHLCQRYFSKHGIFTLGGVEPLTSCPPVWHHTGGLAKRKYHANGTSKPLDYGELTNSLDVDGKAC